MKKSAMVRKLHVIFCIVVIAFSICFYSACSGESKPLMILPDTNFIYMPFERGLHFNLAIQGGTEPYIIETQYIGENWKKLTDKVKAGMTAIDIDLDIEKLTGTTNFWGIHVKDKKKEDAMFYFVLTQPSNDGWYSAIHCDKPFATVGESIIISLINENLPSKMVFNGIFEIGDEFQYSDSDSVETVANVEKTDDGYVVVPEKAGVLFLKGGFNGEENIYTISIIDN